MLLHPISSWTLIVIKLILETALMAKAGIFKNLHCQEKKHHHMKTYLDFHKMLTNEKKSKRRAWKEDFTTHVKFFITKVKVFYIVAKSDI